MAAPNNLSLHSSFPSAQQQSLRTPDASSLFSSSPSLPTPHDISLPDDVSSVNSLEDLLSFSGITCDSNGPIKRHIDQTELPDSKRIKRDTYPQDHIPSILPHTTSSFIPSILSTSKPQLPISSGLSPPILNGGVVLPLLNLPNSSILTNSVTAGSNNLALSQSSISHSTTDSGTVSQANGGSVALLVQLYKHFQSTGDSAGMEKIHQQLLALHSQLASKAGAYLSSLAGSATTNHLLLAGKNQVSTSNPVCTANSLLQTSSNITGWPAGDQFKANSTGTSRQPTFQLPTSTDKPQTTMVTQPQLGNNNSPLSAVTTNQSNTIFSSGLNFPLQLPSTNQLSTANLSLLNPPFNGNPTPTTNTTSTPLAQLLTGNLTNFISAPSNLKNSTSHGSLVNNHTLLKSVGEQPGFPASLLDAGPKPLTNLPSTLSSTPVNSPSIVTHSLSSPTSSATGLSPLPGLQVTAQTQANVLRAVYSYRIQRIQEFLASLPAHQRPTTTQELKELLTKHNILTKAFPPDIVANLQQQLSSSSVQPSTTTTVTTNSSVNVTSSSNQLSAGGGQTAATTTTTASASSLGSAPGPLPGVTLETLRTLCRLPEADLVRIPMPSMLLTVVQYMRANKWNGSSTDLPTLIQQAQEALAKGKLTAATPQPPFQTNPILLTKTSSQHQPKPTTSVSMQQQKSSNPSPLSQYMASVGMKLPFSVNNHIAKPTVSLSKPTVYLQNSTQYFQGKSVQEQAEKERLTALQKVLQSSEEARIAFRFQAHLDKLHQQINSHEIHRPFSTWQDLVLRLLPYHVYREPELPSGAMEKADAVYEGIAGVLLSRGQGLMNQYQHLLLKEEQRQSEDDSATLVLKRLWLEGERERKAEEERQKREAEQIAAELSVVGRTNDSSFLDSDPFLLDSDSYNDYPFLDQFWGDGLGDDISDFDLGIT